MVLSVVPKLGEGAKLGKLTVIGQNGHLESIARELVVSGLIAAVCVSKFHLGGVFQLALKRFST